jgi:hypothetical protein
MLKSAVSPRENPGTGVRPARSQVLLGATNPVALGGECLVYLHPETPGLLIKLPHEHRSGRPWYKQPPSRYGKFRQTLRELDEYVAAASRWPQDLDLIERVVGLVDTDRGLGLVVGALHGRDGHLAQTVLHLIKTGAFDADMKAELDRFIARLLDSRLIVHDLKAANIVLAHDAATGSDRFVLIDGIGERLDIPVNWLSQRLNRFNKTRRVRRLRSELAELCAKTARPG